MSCNDDLDSSVCGGTLPDALSAYRKQAGLTRTLMAEKLGVSVGRYGEVEDGIRDLTKSMMRHAWRAGIPAAVIFAISAHEPPKD